MHRFRVLPCVLMLASLPALHACDSGDGDSGQARVRVLNVSEGYSAVDMYVNEGGDASDERILAATAFGTLSDYASLDSDTYQVKFRRNGVSSTLLTLNDARLSDDSHATYVAYGSTGRFSAFRIDEDEDEPDSGRTLLHVLNAAQTGVLDVYLTEDSVSLDDTSPVVSTASSEDAEIDSGAYRLRVTGAGDTDDLRLDLRNVTFESRQIVALVLTSTPGGVLVNVLFVPQQGSLTTRSNTKARVRAAIGMANGGSATASIGGVNLLTAATPGVIASRYAHVDAGTAAVTLSIDGSAVPVADETLTAGADYTLLIWNDAGGVQATLIGDDNRLPGTSGTARIRLLNGMSGLGAPITLAVDFSPIVEGIALGAASDAEEVDSGIEYQLDVTNTNTAALLYTRASTTLTNGGVYTLLMTGGGTMAVNGTLRRDR